MKPKILIVEDDTDISYYLKEILDHEGYDARIAKRAEEALTMLVQEMVDVVLLDLGLPTIQGDELCARLSQKYPKLHIIVVSARDKPYDAKHLKQLGAADYVAKPFLLDDLLARIKKYT